MAQMDKTGAIDKLVNSQVGRLATVRPDGNPHVVPVVYAVVDETIRTMVDHKPKTTSRLQRLANVEASGKASLIVDHYESDWNKLWWVRVDGRAEVIATGPRHSESASALVEKYSVYQERPPAGPAIVISIDHLSWWSSTP